MRSAAIVLGLLLAVFALPVALVHADADTALVLDAGPPAAVSDAGPPPAAAPAANAPLHDPLVDPGAAYSDLQAAKRVGWGALAFGLLVIAARLAGRLGGSIKQLAFLSQGKTAAIVATVGAIGLVAYNALMSGGTLYAALGVALVAGLHLTDATPKAVA
jgi:hypothetical protein